MRNLAFKSGMNFAKSGSIFASAFFTWLSVSLPVLFPKLQIFSSEQMTYCCQNFMQYLTPASAKPEIVQQSVTVRVQSKFMQRNWNAPFIPGITEIVVFFPVGSCTGSEQGMGLDGIITTKISRPNGFIGMLSNMPAINWIQEVTKLLFFQTT